MFSDESVVDESFIAIRTRKSSGDGRKPCYVTSALMEKSSENSTVKVALLNTCMHIAW